MATKKNATKTSKKASSNLSVKTNSQNSKTVSKTAKNAIKSGGLKGIVVVIVFLFVGALCGGGAWFFVCKDDCFLLNGNEKITITLDESYSDESVEIVAFGKDEIESVEIETNLSKKETGELYSTEVGTFYIKYVSSCFKYGTLFKVERVRLVTVVEASEGGE